MMHSMTKLNCASRPDFSTNHPAATEQTGNTRLQELTDRHGISQEKRYIEPDDFL
jgi:hypothetical protein